MVKRILAMLLLLCMLCGVMSGCKKQKITAQEAYEIVLKDLGATSQLAQSPHIHTGTYEGKPCYNIYITVDGLSLAYVVSETGKILTKGPGSEHSH